MQDDYCHIAIYIYSTEETVVFYKRYFDAEVLFSKVMPDKMRVTMLRVGNLKFEMLEGPDEEERIRLSQLNRMTPNHFCLEVDNLDLFSEALAHANVDIEDGVKEMELPPGTHAKICYIHGPSGERIELYQKN